MPDSSMPDPLMPESLPARSRLVDQLSRNYRAVVDEVQSAAAAVNRPLDSVQIIGVSKYVDAETTLALLHAGCSALGESRPQAMWQKNDAVSFPADVRWHLIGHLQRNKIRRSLSFDPVIHSIDSERLLLALAEEATLQQKKVTGLIEINISGEQAKTGLSPEDVRRLLQKRISDHVRLVGLMAMAGWNSTPDQARQQFSETRKLRDDLQQQFGIDLPELSMGMSGDFVSAIAEGATMVRIGSRLFEGINAPSH